MTEERIKELAKECSKKMNDLSDGIQDDEIIVLDYFRTVAAEAREEGIEEAYRAGYEEAAGAPEELGNCLYEWLKEKGG